MPGSILLMSTSTGAPAAFARSLGIMLSTNGVATAALAIPPAMEVAAMRKRLLPLISCFLSINICHILQSRFHVAFFTSIPIFGV